MDEQILKHLRAICLAFPESTEGTGWGNPTFRVHDRVFAMQHTRDGRPTLWCRVPFGLMEALVEIDPERFFIPTYHGHQPWMGIWLDDDVDWEHVSELVADSYGIAAPRNLAEQLRHSAN